MFASAVVRSVATAEDLDRMAPLAQEIFPWLERGIALDWLCRPIDWSNKTDRFKELLAKSKTARKTQQRARSGALPQPALSQHDDLGEVFAPPRRSAK